MGKHLRAIICHMESRSVICHPTQANVPHLKIIQTGQYSIYLPQKDKRLSRPRWLLDPIVNNNVLNVSLM